MKYIHTVISLLVISSISAMVPTICTPSIGGMSSINPCQGMGNSLFPDTTLGSMSGIPGINSGSDMININCHISGSTSGNILSGIGGIGQGIGSTICIPPVQPGMDFIGGMSGNFMQPIQPNGIQITCNAIGMPDKNMNFGNSSWGNDCYTKVGSIFMNGLPGGGSKLNDMCCTLTGPGLNNKLLR